MSSEFITNLANKLIEHENTKSNCLQTRQCQYGYSSCRLFINELVKSIDNVDKYNELLTILSNTKQNGGLLLSVFNCMKNFAPNNVTYNIVLSKLNRCLVETEEFFKSIPEPDEYTWSILMKCISHFNVPLKLSEYYDKMIYSSKRRLNEVAFNIVLEKYCFWNNSIRVFEIWNDLNRYVIPSIVSFNTILNYCSSKQLEHFEKYYQEFLKSSLEPDSYTIRCLITYYGNKKNFLDMLIIFHKYRDAFDPKSKTILLQTCLKYLVYENGIYFAEQLFLENESDCKSFLCYSLLMDGFGRNGNFSKMIHYFDILFQHYPKLISDRTFCILTSHYVSKPDLLLNWFSSISKLLSSLNHIDFENTITMCYNAVVSKSYKLENYSLMFEYVNLMQTNQIPLQTVSLTCLISYYKNDDKKKQEWLNYMQKHCIKPDSILKKILCRV